MISWRLTLWGGTCALLFALLGRVEARESTLNDQALCARCHPDVTAQWRSSAHHHSSFNNPYYEFAARAFHEQRGDRDFEFCARCHDPALLPASGERFDFERPEREVGISCNLCHSIAGAPDPRGNAHYTLKLADFERPGPRHRARFSPPVLRSSALCASCHKVSLSPELTRDRWQRGQDDADVWSQSAYGGGEPLEPLAPLAPLTPLSLHEPQADETPCQVCHMPRVKVSLRERGARGGRVRDHRFWSANASLLNLRGDLEGVREMARGLQGKISLELSLSDPPEMSSSSVDPIAADHPSADHPSDSASGPTLEVTLLNQGVGHRFPGGVNDTNEAWLEVSVWGSDGALIASSGLLPEDRALARSSEVAPSAPLASPLASPLALSWSRADLSAPVHMIRAQAVDAEGTPLRHRDVSRHASALYDTSLHPHEPRVVRYILPPRAHRVRVRLRMRQFEAYYAREACASVKQGDEARSARCADQPILTLAQATHTTRAPHAVSAGPTLTQLWGLTYGLTADVSRVETALSEPWRTLISPAQRHLLAVTVARALGQTDRVVALNRRALTRALAHRSTLPLWALWTEAQALAEAFRAREALASAQALSRRRPRDWAISALLARLLGEAERYRESFEETLRLESLNAEYAELWRLRALALRGLSAQGDFKGTQRELEQMITRADELWERYRVDRARQSALRRAATQSDLAPRMQAIPTYLITP